MTGNLFPILIAGATAMLAFGVTQVATSLFNDERRKLKQRLTGDSRANVAARVAKSIVLQDNENSGIGALLSKASFFDNLRKVLLQAYPDVNFSRFIGLASGIGSFLGLLVYLYSGSKIGGLVALAFGCYVPIVFVNNRRAKRQRMLADQLPEALDFLSRILRAGHSLSTGLQMMADELPQPLASEFRRAYDQHSFGQALDESLKDMAVRVESTDFAFFVTAVLIQRQTGGDLSEVLSNISGMIRQRIRLQMHVKAKTAEGRFTGYFLSAFPMIMFAITYFLNPDYAGVLVTTNTGLILTGVAIGLQLLGLVFIKKITTVVV